MATNPLDIFLKRADADRKKIKSCFKASAQMDLQLLAKILKHNAATSFGREHRFSKIKNLRDYQSAVPICAYDEYAHWIEKSAATTKSVLTKDPIIYFRKSSGTTGASKKLPVTKASQLSDIIAFRLVYSLPFQLFPRLRLKKQSVLNLIFNGYQNEPPHLSSGVPWGSMTDEFGRLLKNKMRPFFGMPGSDARWYKTEEAYTAADLTYFRLRMAIEAELAGIVATNPSTMTALARKLNEVAPVLIEDVHNGTAFQKPFPGCTANKKRAREIAALFKPGRQVRLHELWPELQYAQTWTAGSCSFYLPQLQSEIGEAAQILPFPYGASEGLAGYILDGVTAQGGFLAPFAYFCEFVPASEDLKSDSQTQRGCELEAGGHYHLIHTAWNGLYRYSVGDVIKVNEVIDGVPRIEFLHRAGSGSSFTGEKITEAQIVSTVKEAVQMSGLPVVNYTCCPQWGDPPRYCFLFELESATDAAKKQSAQIAEHLDRILSKNNSEYPSKRETGRLAMPEVYFVPRGTFDRVREARADSKAAALNQIKEKPLQKDDGFLRTLQSLR